MAKYVCPACEADLDRKYDICPSCGITLKETDNEYLRRYNVDEVNDLIMCPKCGWSYSKEHDVCPYCNEKLDENQRAKQTNANKEKKEQLKVSRRKEYSNYRDEETETNIDVLMSYANLVMNVYIFLAILCGIIGFILLFIEGGFAFGILLFVITGCCVFLSFIHPAFIRNKALILKNIYQINLNQMKKKN